MPKIVAVGDQSAGKSSLIEGISEIRVPRESGICTRCPLQIKTTADKRANAVWKCTVSLVKKYDYIGSGSVSGTDLETCAAGPFYPWVEKSEATTVTFAEVEDKEQLEHIIRCAQIATLNPRKDPRLLVDRDISDLAIEVEFSPNLIVLSITGPGLPSLTFFDLPGLISNAQNDEDRYNLKLIKNLMRMYVKQDNTIVLTAIPMDQEIETSTASGLLRKDNVANRCVGVLTKPDRYTAPDRVAHWNEVLSGKSYKFGYGYYVARQPSSQEIAMGITHAQAREAESAFFESEQWKSRFHGFNERLGTRKLQIALSEMLSRLILKCLPGIVSQVESKRIQIDAQLAKLPEPPANSIQEVITVLMSFERKVSQFLNDDIHHHALWRGWLKINDGFRRAIADLKPSLLLWTDPPDISDIPASTTSTPQKAHMTTTSSKRTANVAVINIGISEDDDTLTATPTPSKRLKTQNGAAIVTPTRLKNTQKPSGAMSRASETSVKKKQFKLPEIQTILEYYCANGLGGIDRRAIDSMILSTLEDWHEPMLAALGAVETELRKMLLQSLEEACAKYRSTELYREMSSLILDRFLPSHIRRQGETLKTLLALERTKPMTKDRGNFERLEMEEHDHLVKARHRQRVRDYFDVLHESSGKPVSEEVRARGEADDKLRQRLGQDQFRREIEAAARVRGYYLLASSRFIDHVCQLIENDLFQRFKDELREELLDGLHIRDEQCKSTMLDHSERPHEANKAAGHDYSARLLEDNPDRVAKRKTLKTQRARLEQAHFRLEELKRQFGTDVHVQIN